MHKVLQNIFDKLTPEARAILVNSGEHDKLEAVLIAAANTYANQLIYQQLLEDKRFTRINAELAAANIHVLDALPQDVLWVENPKKQWITSPSLEERLPGKPGTNGQFLRAFLVGSASVPRSRVINLGETLVAADGWAHNLVLLPDGAEGWQLDIVHASSVWGAEDVFFRVG